MATNRAQPGHLRPLLSRVGLPALCVGVMTCGGDGGPREPGAINLSPSNISFTTAPGGALDAKTVGITPATVDLTGLMPNRRVHRHAAEPMARGDACRLDGDAGEPGDPLAEGE